MRLVLGLLNPQMNLDKSILKHAARRRQPRISARYSLPGVLAAVIALAACGKVGDPLPPIPRAPLIVTDLIATQQGTNILLSFPVSKQTRSDKLKRVDIYRLVEQTSAPLALPEEEFASRATVIASLSDNELPSQTSTVSFTDPIDFKGQNRGTRLRYAVRLINQSDRPADLSNYATLTPLGTVATAPGKPEAEVAQYDIQLRWAPPTGNLDGSAPANVFGYNLYRRQAGVLTKVNRSVLKETRYTERQFAFGTRYEYVVRALSLPREGAPATELVESDDSAVAAVTPVDTFPPSAPASITIASRGGIVSLFWPANPEPDVVGYNIYRSEDEKSWIKITARPITTITFNDRQVQAGKRYFYRISAIDNAGNESTRSDVVSEIVEAN